MQRQCGEATERQKLHPEMAHSPQQSLLDSGQFSSEIYPRILPHSLSKTILSISHNLLSVPPHPEMTHFPSQL